MLCSTEVLVNSDHTGGRAVTLKCKRWSCPICRPENRARVKKLARDGVPDKFLTLTCKPDRWASPDEAARGMREAFRLLIRLIRRHHKARTVEYFRVFEAHKSGWPHLHILLRAPFITQDWLSEEWQRLTGAFIVDIRKVKNKEQAAFYVSKYIGKDLHKFEGVTRYHRSRKWNKPKDDQDQPKIFQGGWHKDGRAPQFFYWQTALDIEKMGGVIVDRRLGYLEWVMPMEVPDG